MIKLDLICSTVKYLLQMNVLYNLEYATSLYVQLHLKIKHYYYYY